MEALQPQGAEIHDVLCAEQFFVVARLCHKDYTVHHLLDLDEKLLTLCANASSPDMPETAAAERQDAPRRDLFPIRVLHSDGSEED